MDFGFVILCPDRNVGGVKNTVGSIRHHSYDRDCLCVLADDATPEELTEVAHFCPTVQDGGTLTGLINQGVQHTRHDWAFLLFAGSRIMPFLEHKLKACVKAENEVLFPVVDRRANFVDGSFNGVLLNTGFFRKVGEFPTQAMRKQGHNDFHMAKLFWALAAMEHGVCFKAIVGLKIL